MMKLTDVGATDEDVSVPDVDGIELASIGGGKPTPERNKGGCVSSWKY